MEINSKACETLFKGKMIQHHHDIFITYKYLNVNNVDRNDCL